MNDIILYVIFLCWLIWLSVYLSIVILLALSNLGDNSIRLYIVRLYSLLFPLLLAINSAFFAANRLVGASSTKRSASASTAFTTAIIRL